MRILAAVLALAATAAAAQPASAPGPSDWRALDPENTVVMETTKGQVVIELLPAVAPLAAERIRTLARKGYYDGALFYRVAGFMAQGGDKGARTFRSDLPDLKAEFTFPVTSQTPFARVGGIPGGAVGFVGTQPVRVNTTASGPWQGTANFCPGSVAMPHYDDPNTANSQLFIMKIPSPTMDGTFTIFAHVLAGMEVVRMLNEGEPPPSPDRMTRVRVLADMPVAERPAIQVMDAKGPVFLELVRETSEAKGPAFTLCDVETPVRPAP